ncbi:MAG: right-handed parallel beta-helix repeat-containing protein [Synergistaceae bacterium]|nr:right-handed parallel beta-helix repeat-containing protein [Synergistaceae bacterium]
MNTQSTPYRTIQKAISELADGDTVEVASGEYAGYWGGDGSPKSYTVKFLAGEYGLGINDISDRVTLIGAGEKTIIKRGKENMGGYIFRPQTEGITFKDLKFSLTASGDQSALAGIQPGQNAQCSGMTVENVTFDGGGEINIGMYFSARSSDATLNDADLSRNVVIKNCTFENFTAKGIYFAKGGEVTIENCTFRNIKGAWRSGDSIAGIDISSTYDANDKIIIRGNKFENIQVTGAASSDNWGAPSSSGTSPRPHIARSLWKATSLKEIPLI